MESQATPRVENKPAKIIKKFRKKCCRILDIWVSEVMEAAVRQSRLLLQLGKLLGHVLRVHGLTVRMYEDEVRCGVPPTHP